MKRKDITNQIFGRLTALKIEKIQNKKTYWRFRCSCDDKEVIRSLSIVVRGECLSCGCLRKETCAKLKSINQTHGLTQHRLYYIWDGMKGRCYNKNNPEYHNYGERGITVCDEWKDNFQTFYDWAMENGYEEDLTIDRIDNDWIYCEENCRWVTWKVQGRNKRNNHLLTFNNETYSISEWTEKLNYPQYTISNRLRKGWSLEKILTTPPKKYKV
jgi:hypothetical protein